MGNKNNSIAYDKIDARDITDTQRRGSCMCLAYTFGLAGEIWAKMRLESGWGVSEEEGATVAPKAPAPSLTAPVAAAAEVVKASESTFREQALEKGVHTVAIDALVGIVKEKLGGDFSKGLQTLGSKTAAELNDKYAPAAPAPAPASEGENW